MDRFDPQNREHVEWLKKLTEANTEDKFKIINKNPMECEFSGAEMVQVLFGLCAKYTQAIFQKRALILQDGC